MKPKEMVTFHIRLDVIATFYYLTGFNEPNAWMIIFSDGKRLNEDIIISKKKDKIKNYGMELSLDSEKQKQTIYLIKHIPPKQLTE